MWGGQRHNRGERVERIGMHDLVERGVVRCRRRQCNRRNVLEPAVELLRRHAVTPRDGLQLFAEEPDVVLRRFRPDHFGIDLPGNGFEHTFSVLLLQIRRQSLRGRILPFAGAELVPGDLDGQPLLRPVAGKPRDEVGLAALVDAASPVFHEAARVVPGRYHRRSRGGENVAIDLPPGTLRDVYRRHRVGGAT
jgi:hypothetical protein